MSLLMKDIWCAYVYFVCKLQQGNPFLFLKVSFVTEAGNVSVYLQKELSFSNFKCAQLHQFGVKFEINDEFIIYHYQFESHIKLGFISCHPF